MSGQTLIKKLSLTALLSYGEWQEIRLEPLNILIGPNMSGKSNLIEVLRLLQAAPSDITLPIRLGGGFAEWLWKGQKVDSIGGIDVQVDYPEALVPRLAQAQKDDIPLLRHQILFADGPRLEIAKEEISHLSQKNNLIHSFYSQAQGKIGISVRGPSEEKSETDYAKRVWRRLDPKDLKPQQSILSQITDKYTYPEITYLGHQFSQLKLYTDWDLGRNAPLRKPQKIDDPNDFLLEDASNLALVLNDLLYRGYRSRLIADLQQLYDGVLDIITKVEGGTIQLFIQEEGQRHPISAARLSDGFLRYLSLLAILRHPKPPSLICIEEPELGLHPDILPMIAELLVEASQRTQLIVTTHSDVLISALPNPEMVLVCERDAGGSHLHRLDAESLKDWLENYTLGDLWRMGEIGGTRW